MREKLEAYALSVGFRSVHKMDAVRFTGIPELERLAAVFGATARVKFTFQNGREADIADGEIIAPLHYRFTKRGLEKFCDRIRTELWS